MALKFKGIKRRISAVDRISICMWETLEYKNYNRMSEVSDEYDDLYLYGIGIIESECNEPDASGDFKIAFRPQIEIMLSDTPRCVTREEDVNEPVHQ